MTANRGDPVRDAAVALLAVVDAYPPEVMDEPDNAWRLGGRARHEWARGLRELRSAVNPPLKVVEF